MIRRAVFPIRAFAPPARTRVPRDPDGNGPKSNSERELASSREIVSHSVPGIGPQISRLVRRVTGARTARWRAASD